MKRVWLILAFCLCLLSPSSATQVFFPVKSALAADLQFANSVYIGCTATSCLTNSNSTGGYCTDSTGVLHLIGANTLRVCSGSGLLIEKSSTNGMFESQALATSPWSTSGLNSTAANNAASAPDGTSTASSLADTVTTAAFQVGQLIQSGSISAGTSAFLVYMKAGSQSWGTIQFNNGSNASVAYFNLSGAGATGSITALAGSANITASGITPFANGWYSCAILLTYTSGSSELYLGPASGNGGRSYTGTGAIANYYWGAQLENQGAFSSSYIPTTTGTASRSADSITISGVLATVLAGSTGTIVANTNSSRPSVAASIVDANGTSLLAKSALNAGLTVVGALLTTGNAGTWSSPNDLGLAWDASGGAIQLNNGSIVTDSTARTPSAPFYLGATSGSSAFFNGYITRLTAYTTKLGSPQ